MSKRRGKRDLLSTVFLLLMMFSVLVPAQNPYHFDGNNYHFTGDQVPKYDVVKAFFNHLQ